MEIIYKLTDPVLLPAQKLISKLIGGRSMMVDLSPIVVFLVIRYIIKPLILALVALF